MLRSLPRTIDDALDTLYEPNAVFSQFLGSASMTFFFFLFSFPCFLFLSCLSLFFLSFLFFPFLSRFFASLSFLSFPLSSFVFFVFFPNGLASVVRMRSDRYYVQYIRGSLSWVAAVYSVFPGASSETYAPV